MPASSSIALQEHQQTGNEYASPNQAQPAWQRELSEATLTLEDLLDRLRLSKNSLAELLEQNQIDQSFPLLAPKAYLEKIQAGDPTDPLLRQILPLARESEQAIGFVPDPLGESDSNPVSGLLHKYRSRVLLTVTSKCAIHCRYCFRREFPYHLNNPGKKGWTACFDYLRSATNINEVILSGGDPLSASDKHLSWICQQLAEIPHLKRLRIHTRLPVVMPSRVCEALLDWLSEWHGQKIVVLHCNHANEIDSDVEFALQKFCEVGAHLFNQSVLLKGVNDRAETLAELSERLFSANIIPYYIHMLDPVKGAHHFKVERQRAIDIYTQLSELLPGFLLPKLVEEIAGARAKQMVAL